MMAVCTTNHTDMRRSTYEAAFLAVLPRGRGHAITARELGRLMAPHVGAVVDERTVRQIASDLRLRGEAICSAVHRPYGFYAPTCADEAERGMAHVFSREREVRKIAKACRVTIRGMRRSEMAALIQALPGMGEGA